MNHVSPRYVITQCHAGECSGADIDGKHGAFVIDTHKLPNHRVPSKRLWTLSEQESIKAWFQEMSWAVQCVVALNE